ncbi:MAG: copper chaperone PCu(A)C [Thiobacillus sp.]|nr:copper chaperone PCu(A)C [Thiobacillus sp.]
MQRTLILALLGLTLSASALADNVKVDNAWVRATAPGQKVAGGFLDLTADADMKLVGGSSPASSTLELHMMKMDGGVMEMRQIPEIALPKGKTVSLKPGGLHIMFIDLKQRIREGDKVPVTLTVKNAAGKEQQLQVEAQAMRAGGMAHHH